MAEHDGQWGLLLWREVAPIKVGLDSSIRVVRAEVWQKHSGVHEGQSQASQNAAKKDWVQERTPAVWGGSYWEQGFSLVGGVFVWVQAGND